MQEPTTISIPNQKENKSKINWTALSIILRIAEFLWNIFGIYIVALQRNNWQFLLFYILVVIECFLMVFCARTLECFTFFLTKLVCIFIPSSLQFSIPGITANFFRQAFMLGCSLTTTGNLVYNAYYVTDTSQFFGTNFTLAYSFGLIAFNTLALQVYFRTEFFSFADFFMRVQISRVMASLLDSFSLISMLDDRPWDNFSKAVFSIFIISIPYPILSIWLNYFDAPSVENKLVVKENVKEAKFSRIITIFCNMSFVDIPFLIIRLIGFYTYSLMLSAFIVKNAISILVDIIEIFQIMYHVLRSRTIKPSRSNNVL